MSFECVESSGRLFAIPLLHFFHNEKDFFRIGFSISFSKVWDSYVQLERNKINVFILAFVKERQSVSWEPQSAKPSQKLQIFRTSKSFLITWFFKKQGTRVKCQKKENMEISHFLSSMLHLLFFLCLLKK